MRRRLVALIVAVASYAAACGSAALSPNPPDDGPVIFDPAVVFAVINRTESAIAFNPDIVVEPCDERAFTRAELDRAMAESYKRIENGEDIGVPGAVDFSSVQFSRPIGSTFPAVLVVTDQRSWVEFEPFDRSSLPACSGHAESP